MIQIKEITTLKAYLHSNGLKGTEKGFVPTMGALHTGHISLLNTAKKASGVLVCSIFVNPTQFNDPKDFEKYPVTLEEDIQLVYNAGVDILFLPTTKELYPTGTGKLGQYDLGGLEKILEGQFRPGHFQGVCQVMDRLLATIEPDTLFMGQKDFQQCMVVKKLLAELGSQTTLVTCPTIREKDGLAMSSRNRRLSPAAREKAKGIYETLLFVKSHLVPGTTSHLLSLAEGKLRSAGFRVEYIVLANAASLEIMDHWNGQTELVCLIAAFLDDVRLIDNMILTK